MFLGEAQLAELMGVIQEKKRTVARMREQLSKQKQELKSNEELLNNATAAACLRGHEPDCQPARYHSRWPGWHGKNEVGGE